MLNDNNDDNCSRPIPPLLLPDTFSGLDIRRARLDH